MAHRKLVVALALIAAASPLSAAGQEAVPVAGAPAGTPETLYCMHIEAVTGSRLERVKCWTRAEWTDRGVDIDKDWAKEGVTTIG